MLLLFRKGFEYVMAEEVVYTPGQRCWNLDRAIVTSLDLCPLIQLNLLLFFHTSSQNMTSPRGCARDRVKDAREPGKIAKSRVVEETGGFGEDLVLQFELLGFLSRTGEQVRVNGYVREHHIQHRLEALLGTGQNA